MAFKQVFCALREVFPQVDLRILKAVASQYSSDVDAAVGFVFSDVLPAVSEPTETHYTLQDIDHAEHDLTDSKKPNLHSGRISSVDLGAKEDASVLFGTSAENSVAVGECNPFSEYDGPFCSNNKIEKCSQIEDKVVINEIKIPTTAMNSLLQEHYTQVGSSSTSPMAPHMIEYEHSDSGGCNDCAAEKDKVTPETENIGTPMHYNDNCDLSDLFASSGSMLPLFMESSSDCAVKHEGKMPLELSDAISKHDIANLEDNCCLETLFGNFHSMEERHTSKNLLDAPTVLSKPKDNYDLQVLFENIDNTGKELGVLHTAETPPELNKLANDGSFHSLFGELCTVDKTTQVPSNFPVKGGSNTVHKEELTLIHSNNCETLIHCNFNDDKHFVCPIVELDAFRPNEEWKMPVAHKSEGILDISTHSYHITDLNKNFSDTTKSKELLTSLYESTIMKMKEVELQEENSRLAKQNAYTAHQNFLAMVEHFDHLIENSKESNDKQAQVVCEEKCLLAALTQDLQSQLTKLSAQRDEALTAVQKIKCELDARLATSMEEEATAMDHIIQEEKLALLVRKEKEATMGSIMEESRKLQQEAEENTLLRRLLLDQGRLIDIMQGEMSSIHANVVAMKERTRGSKLKSALVMTSCSANSYHKDDCKSALADTDRPMGNGENRNDVPHEETTRSLAKDHTSCPDEDDEWEVLETNYA